MRFTFYFFTLCLYCAVSMSSAFAFAPTNKTNNVKTKTKKNVTRKTSVKQKDKPPSQEQAASEIKKHQDEIRFRQFQQMQQAQQRGYQQQLKSRQAPHPQAE